MDFILEHLVEIIFALVSAGALALCRYFYKKYKSYKDVLDANEDAALNETIQGHLEPLNKRIEELATTIEKMQEEEKQHLDPIIASYRFRLLQLCRQAISQGYLSQREYDQLTEFYKVYHSLGGNGQAQEYYDKAMQLEVRPNV